MVCLMPHLSPAQTLLLVSSAVWVTTLPVLAKLPSRAETPVDFVKDVQPILQKACSKCHGEEKQKGGFRVDAKRVAMTGGDNHAPNIIPGKSAESPLIRFVAGLDEDMQMPPKGERLSADQIGILRRWIDDGAAWPESATV